MSLQTCIALVSCLWSLPKLVIPFPSQWALPLVLLPVQQAFRAEASRIQLLTFSLNLLFLEVSFPNRLATAAQLFSLQDAGFTCWLLCAHLPLQPAPMAPWSLGSAECLDKKCPANTKNSNKSWLLLSASWWNTIHRCIVSLITVNQFISACGWNQQPLLSAAVHSLLPNFPFPKTVTISYLICTVVGSVLGLQKDTF